MGKEAKKGIIKKIKTIQFNFERPFKTNLKIETKKIYNQKTIIEIIDNTITISFMEKNDNTSAKEIELSYAYIDQICVCVRNLIFINCDFNNFINSNISKEIDKIIMNQTLLYNLERFDFANKINQETFFCNFKSTNKPDYYKYINNSIPWFILLSQERLLSEKYRILFTIIEMIICCEHIELRSNGQTENRYRSFINEIKLNNDKIKKIRELFSSLLCKPESLDKKDGDLFVITKFSKIVNNVFVENSNIKSQIYLVLYKYRCNMFHGSMNPIIKFSTQEYIVLLELFTILKESLYKYMCNLIRNAIK